MHDQSSRGSLDSSASALQEPAREASPAAARCFSEGSRLASGAQPAAFWSTQSTSNATRIAGGRASGAREAAVAAPTTATASGKITTHGVLMKDMRKRSVLRCKHLRLWHEASSLPRQAGGAPPASRSRRTKAHGTSERAPARENLSREQACQTQSQSQSQQESAASRRRSKRSSHEKARPPEREVTRVQEAAQVHSTRHPNLGEK